MLPERYEYEIGRSYKQYDFYSEGPNGRIRIAKYSKEINQLFDIQGLTEGNGWEPFKFVIWD